MTKPQIVGLVLWRGGIAFAVGYGLFLGVREALEVLKQQGMEIPDLLVTGISSVIAGSLLFMVSLAMEQFRDASTNKERQG
jgi:hypothetical protein